MIFTLQLPNPLWVFGMNPHGCEINCRVDHQQKVVLILIPFEKLKVRIVF
jgi:hypothetical protein